MLLLRVVYRFVIDRATYPAVLRKGEPFTLDIVWENHGVGHLFSDKYHLRCYLISGTTIKWGNSDTTFDPTGFVNGNGFDSNNPDTWFNNANEYLVKSKFTLPPSTPIGTWDLKIAIVRDDNYVPAILLAIDDKDSQNRYKLGTMEVTP